MLPIGEPEASAVAAESWNTEGIAIHTGRRAVELRRDGDQTMVVLDDGAELRAERPLMAVGRSINVRGLGLDTVGLTADARLINVEVDDHMVAGDKLWAVGDVTGKGLFTHVGMYQANIAIVSILGEDHEGADYSAMSRATFTEPEVGSVGLTKQQECKRPTPSGGSFDHGNEPDRGDREHIARSSRVLRGGRRAVQLSDGSGACQMWSAGMDRARPVPTTWRARCRPKMPSMPSRPRSARRPTREGSRRGGVLARWSARRP
ncbi:FAD-dependent oxidoreductase [Ilumatobacter sp.]|uniref:FAD-dependent oxidoreductase n=1 Tax=Ilumatobacter sp. TaxID=1967498 RepID=UPI003751CB4B